jgi:hypothetical protein
MRLAASRIIIALAVVAIAAPAASARGETGTVGPSILRAPQAAQLTALHHAEAQTRAAHAYRPPRGAAFSTATLGVYARDSQRVSAASATTKDPGDDFDYGAAAIGAGLAAAVVLLVSGSIVVVRRRGQLQHS